MASSAQYHGALVAFEGPADLISTQLRLLPSSTQIAVLPSAKEFLEPEDPEAPFEACRFVKRVHDAVARRMDAALAFLENSTPTRKRLVFMNGGTPSAQTVCIRAISQNLTDGDIAKAETIFAELVKGGLAALEQRTNRSLLKTLDHSAQDPITKAMRAADALDRKTANLQPSSDIDLTIANRRSRSTSLPRCGSPGIATDTASTCVLGTLSTGQYVRPQTQPRQTLPLDSSSPGLAITTSDNFGTLPPSLDLILPSDDVALGSDFLTTSSAEPVFDEQASPEHPLTRKRSRSIAQVRRNKPWDPDTPILPKHQQESFAETATRERLENPPPVPVVDLEGLGLQDEKSRFSKGPNPINVEACRNKMPSSRSSEGDYLDHDQARTSHVYGMSDAHAVDNGHDTFRPVLPFHEDLVVHFQDDNHDPVLGYMINAFKNSADYTCPSHNLPPHGCLASPRTMKRLANKSRANTSAPLSPIAARDEDSLSLNDDDFPGKPRQPVSQDMAATALPTPAHTPPLMLSEPEDKFHDFNPVPGQTAVATQNALRLVLDIYFPQDDTGYSQFRFPLLPELDGLWKPVFHATEPGENPTKDKCRVDQILAVGAQRGVTKTFLSGVTSQLEELGTKPNGISRTGKLNLRYLIANAMQSFTAQPLAKQTHDSPFTNTHFLATLLVPHLETYFSTHSEVRFLILEYPPDHFSTVVALQKLVGVELLKVVQVIDATTKESPSLSHVHGGLQAPPALRSHSSSTSTTLQLNGSKSAAPSSSQDDLAGPDAKLVITTSATDEEVSTFVATVRTMLIKRCDFYTLEKESNSSTSLKMDGSLPITQQSMSPPASPLSQIKKHSREPSSIKSFSHRTSVMENLISHGLNSLQGDTNPVAGDDRSAITFDFDSDSEVDAEEKRLVPMFLRKEQRRKGNSRKALKFLGLA